jgi:hypothetical protein
MHCVDCIICLSALLGSTAHFDNGSGEAAQYAIVEDSKSEIGSSHPIGPKRKIDNSNCSDELLSLWLFAYPTYTSVDKVLDYLCQKHPDR